MNTMQTEFYSRFYTIEDKLLISIEIYSEIIRQDLRLNLNQKFSPTHMCILSVIYSGHCINV